VAPAVEAGASEPSPRPAPQEGRRDAVESRPAQAAAGEAADSDVVLKMTEDVDHESYVWMPFQTPMVLGSEIIDGFWWHPGVTSPVDAFKSYLRRHHYPVPRGSWGSSLLRPGRARRTEETSSGNSVYDQVVRERQLLIQRNGLLFGTPPVSPPKVQQAEPGLRAPR